MDAGTLHVFRRAADARAFHAAAPGLRPAFHVLPFAWLPLDAPPPPARLLRASHERYPADRLQLLLGIDWLADPPGSIDVLNLSLGPEGDDFERSDPLQIATRAVHDSGVTVVVAAGNEGPAPGTLQALARAPWTVAVGACDRGGERLLDTSSRGRRGGRGPTVVAVGHSQIVLVDGANFEPGTSFAAPKVARLALWLGKCLELLLLDVQDVRAARWSPASPPVRLPVLGLADTGVDPSALAPLPPEVQAWVRAGNDAVALPRSEARHRWLQRWLAEIDRLELVLPLRASPALVERALRLAARPLAGYRRHEVGAGCVDVPRVGQWLSTLTPCRLAAWLCPAMTLADELALADGIEGEGGALWDGAFVATTLTWFHDGHRLRVAKVA